MNYCTLLLVNYCILSVSQLLLTNPLLFRIGSNRGRNLRKILTEGGTSSKVISQRQNDKMAAMTTEKYSGLRIKCVCKRQFISFFHFL